MNRITFLFFFTFFIENISTFEIKNLYSSYMNPNICNSSPPNNINCYYEINVWHYVPSEINKIYFTIPSNDASTDIKLYIGKIENNELSNIKIIEKNSQNKYEVLRDEENIYVTFTKKQNGNKKIILKHFYSDNINSDINEKNLQLSYYINYPIEITSSPFPQSFLSFYDYENDPDKIYIISNYNYYIYYINSNSSSINYNTNNMNFLDDYEISNYYAHKLYKNGDFYYLISKMIFIKIEKKANSLNLIDISSNNEKFAESKIKNDANVKNLEQIEYSNGELMNLYFTSNNKHVCSIEYGCSINIINDMIFISFYYNGECFLVKNRDEIYRCTFRFNSNNSKMELKLGNIINNRFIDEEGYIIYQIKVFPLDELHSNFLLCSSSMLSLFCIVFNYNSIENDLNSKTTIKIFENIDDINGINVFPYRSNNDIVKYNLIIVVYKNEYSIIDVDNNISITGKQTFKFNGNIFKDSSLYDLGNNKFILTYSSGIKKGQLNIGLDMGTIPKNKKILKIIKEYQEYYEISFKELFDQNKKLSNENYKVIFIPPMYNEEESTFDSNNIEFYYKDISTNFNFYDENNNNEYEININDDSQKLIIKLTNERFNILLNYTIIGEQLASKNLLKIMNLAKCNEFCLTCDYELSYLSDNDNHYCIECKNNYEYFLKMEKDGNKFYNCYSSCASNKLYNIVGQKECHKECPEKTPFYIKSTYQCFEKCPDNYYLLENSLECSNECPERYFYDNKNRKCIKICPEGYYGDISTQDCVTDCQNGFFKDKINHLCVGICPDNLFGDVKNKICIDECPENLFEDNINKKCVENCPENMFKNKKSHKCVETCPEGEYGDNEFKICVKSCKTGFKRDIISDTCIYNNTEIFNNSDCLNYIKKNYENLNDPEEIYKCNNLKIQIYSGDSNSTQISKKISNKNNMTSLDIERCLDYIVNNNKNISSRKDLIIIVIENPSTYSLADNFNFYIYDSNNNIIDLKICKENNIQVSISKDLNLNESTKNAMKYYKEKYSIDITDPNEDCFNDICYALQTEDGLDISLEYRRKKIFLNNICGQNIEYEINYQKSSINCYIYGNNNNLENIENNEFNENIKKENNFITEIIHNNINFNILKCYNLAFDIPKAIKNIANWIILGLFIIKFLFLIIYLFTYMSKLETFLGTWNILKDIKPTKNLNSENINFMQTIQPENNDISTKRQLNSKKINKNKGNNENNNNNTNNKKNIFESLSTLVHSITVQKANHNINTINNINNDAAPPKKKHEGDKKKKKGRRRAGSVVYRKKREEKEFIFEKIDKINYTKYIDKEDDVISDGCYPVVVIDKKKKDREERKKREEEEKKRKEEEEIKRKEEEEKRRIEREERKLKKEEEKKLKEEEEERKKEEEKKKREEEKKKREEEKRKREEILKKEIEERKIKEEEKRKEEEEKKKKEDKIEEINRIRIMDERQKRILLMKKKREEENLRWKKELERKELLEEQIRRKNKEEIRKKMNEIYIRRNYGFEEENNYDFLKKIEQIEKGKKKIKKIEEEENNNENDIKVESYHEEGKEKDENEIKDENKNIDENDDNEQKKEEDEYLNEFQEDENDEKNNEDGKEGKSEEKKESDSNEEENEKKESEDNEEEEEEKDESNDESENEEEEDKKVEDYNEEDENINSNRELEDSNKDDEKTSNNKQNKESSGKDIYLNIENEEEDEKEVNEEDEDEKEVNEEEEIEEKDEERERKMTEIEEKKEIKEEDDEDNYDNDEKISKIKDSKNENCNIVEKKTENEYKIKVKEYMLKDKVDNKRYLSGKERGNNNKRIILKDKDGLSQEKIKEENKSDKINLMKVQNNKYYLLFKKYNISFYRINNLPYEEAIKKDKREYCEIYKYYIFNSEIVLNLIFVPNYLEIFPLKMIFFMYIIGTEGLFIALLFSDKYINNIYDNNGKYKVFYHLPNCLISVAITYVLDAFLYHLIISRNQFQEVMENPKIKNHQKEFESIIKCLKVKIIIFFIIDFIITGFSWYFCSIFCALYKNTAKFWLISLMISLCIHLILPFILCLIPTTIKNCALKNKSRKTYNFNKCLEILI